MTGNIGTQKATAAILPHPSARLDLVPCQGPHCHTPGLRCIWCMNRRQVRRTLAETMGWRTQSVSVRGVTLAVQLLEAE